VARDELYDSVSHEALVLRQCGDDDGEGSHDGEPDSVPLGIAFEVFMPYLNSYTQEISRRVTTSALVTTDQTIIILIRKPDESILLIPRSIKRLRRLGSSISSRHIKTCQAVEGRKDLGLEATWRCRY
jgi:hypothetical protein